MSVKSNVFKKNDALIALKTRLYITFTQQIYIMNQDVIC